jgi:hypothetical protein
LTITESSAHLEYAPEEVHPYTTRPYAYNPASEREVHFYSCGVPRRDIAKGEELFDNYLAMSGIREGHWAEGVSTLKSQCAGEDVGVIVEFELDRSRVSD